MIPITLTIKGVYSYKEKQTIDFRELTSDHLFGIFGTVGSGKSSILEAITFAIYGKIERLNTRGLKYNMMNLSSNEMTIDFTFRANNGKYYNTYSHARRNSKKHEDINKSSRSCYLLDEHDFEKKTPITTQDIEDVIGLSYENFKRTIIIPQGKFQEFLKLGVKERSLMLEEIFDLKKFNLFFKTQSLINKSLTRKSEIEGALSAIGVINSEELQLINGQIEEITTSIAEKNKAKIELDAKKVIFDQLRKDIDDINKLREKLRLSELNRIEIENRRQQLSWYRIYISQFKPILESQRAVNSQLESLNKSILGKKDEHKEFSHQIEVFQNKIVELTPDFENRAILLDKSLDVKNLIEIKNNQIRIKILESESLQSEQKLSTLSQSKADKTKSVKETEMELERLKGLLADYTSLNDAKSWHVVKEKIVKEGNEKSERVKSLEADCSIIVGDIHSILKSVNIDSFDDLEKSLTTIATLILTQKNQLQELETEISELMLAQQLSVYSDSLHDGKPCPLCGALEHPTIIEYKNVAEVLSEKQKNQKLVSTNLEALKSSEIQLKNKQDQKLGLISKIESAKKELEIQRNEYKNHENSFTYSQDLKDKFVVNQQIEKHKTNTKVIETKEKELKDLRILLENTVLELETIEKTFFEIKVKKAEINTLIKQRIESLKQLLSEEYLLKTEDELVKIGADFTQRHQTIEHNFEQYKQNLAELKNKLSGLEGTLEELNKQLLQATQQKQDIDTQLDKERLIHPEFKDEWFTTFSNLTLNIETEESAIKEFDERIIGVKSALKTLEEKSNSSNYDPLVHQEIIVQVAEINNQIGSATEQRGKLSKQLEILTKQLSDHQVLIEEDEKLSNRIGDLTKIKKMFEGNRFVNYVSTYYLENLCKEANKKFIKLTNGHLELVLNSENGFDIKDHMNQGYTRSGDSLSGGQTFQASLCLALALSDIINRKSNILQNFFFMDEGFGSLDNQSLHTVFQTLQALRMENRIVGLISHVEEMKQEIPKCLIITNTDDGGSKIGFSWKN